MLNGIKAVAGIIRDVIVILGVVAAGVSAFFLLRPNLEESTVNLVRIGRIEVEPDVAEASYFKQRPVVLYLGETLEHQPRRLGTVIHFTYEVEGLRNQLLPLRWSLFDARSGRRIGDSEHLDPLPIGGVEARKKGLDSGSWEVWVDTSKCRARRYFIRIEIYGKTTRLAFKDSPSFTPPTCRNSTAARHSPTSA